jgi:F-type H+-transporting ATPase subunit gamma
MANLKDIRSRISTTKNTQQITKAMKLVSAAKLRKAQHNITNLRPYAIKLGRVIADIAATARVKHELLEPKNDPKKVLLVVLTSDRGLCGGFNGSIIKEAEKYYLAQKDSLETLDFLFIGRRGRDAFKKHNVNAVDTVLNMAKDISYGLAHDMSVNLVKYYQEGTYDEIRIVYNEFKSAIQQDIVVERLLPIDVTDTSFDTEGSGISFATDLIFEPSAYEIVESLLKKHFAAQVYRVLSESIASEHGARMTAMENATKNAKEMIDSLTLTYNKLRQASITTELIEITSGAEALNG